MGNKIYYKGKEYGGGGGAAPIEAEKYQLLQGDGKQWTEGGPLFTEKRGKTISEIYLTKDSELGSYISFSFGNTNNQITISDLTIADNMTSSISGYSAVFIPYMSSSKNIIEDTSYNVTNTKKYYSNTTKEYFTIKTDFDAKKAIISPVYDSITNKEKLKPTAGFRDVTFNGAGVPLYSEREQVFYFDVNLGSFTGFENLTVNWNGQPISYKIKDKTISFSTNAFLTDYDKVRNEDSRGLYLYTKDNNYLSLETNSENNSASLSISDNTTANFAGNSTFSIEETAKAIMKNAAEVNIDGAAKILMHDSAVLDMGGTNLVMTIPTSAWDGKTYPPLNPRGNEGNAGLPHLIMHQNAIIEADGAACMVLHQAPNIIFEGNGIFKFGGYTDKAYSTPEIYLESGMLRLGGYYSRDGVSDKTERKPCVTIDVGQFHMQSNYDTTGDPFVTYNGGSTFIMNGGTANTSDETGYAYDPAFILSHDEMLFDGVGSKGSLATEQNDGSISYGLSMSTISPNFGDKFSYFNETASSPRTRARLRGDVCLNIGTIQQNSNDGSKTFVNLQPSAKKSIFVNLTDNAKIDIENDSAILMKNVSGTVQDSDRVIYPSNITGSEGPMIRMLGKPAILMEDNNTLEVNGMSSSISGEVAFRTLSPNYSSGYRPNRFIVRSQNRQFGRIYKIVRESGSQGLMAIQGSVSKNSSTQKNFEINSLNITYDGTSVNLLTSENLSKLVSSTSSSQPLYFTLSYGYSLKTEDGVYYIIKTASGSTTKVATIDISNNAIKVVPIADAGSISFSLTLNFNTSAISNPDKSWTLTFVPGQSDNVYSVILKASGSELSSDFTVSKVTTSSTSAPSVQISAGYQISLDSDMPDNHATYDNFIGFDRQMYANGSLTIGADATLGIFATSTPLIHLHGGSQIKMWNSSIAKIWNNSYLSMSNGSHLELKQGNLSIDTTSSLINLSAGASSLMLSSDNIRISQQGHFIQINPGTISLNATAAGSYAKSSLSIIDGSEITFTHGAKISGTTSYDLSDTDKENPTTSFTFSGIDGKEESVTFTLAELKAIKALLSSTE